VPGAAQNWALWGYIDPNLLGLVRRGNCEKLPRLETAVENAKEK